MLSKGCKTRTAALLICAALCLSFLCSCTVVLPGSCGDPREITLSGAQPYCLPSVSGYSDSDAVNAAIADSYQPYLDLLGEVNAGGVLASMDYTFDRRDDCYIISAFYKGTSTSLPLPKLTAANDGAVYFSEDPPPFALDGDYIYGFMTLDRMGIYTDAKQYGEEVYSSDMYSVFVRYYEAYCSAQIDTTKISQVLSGSDLYLKSAEMFMDYLEDSDAFYSREYPLNSSLLRDRSETLITALQTDFYGQSSQSVTVGDLLDAAALYIRCVFPVPYDIDDPGDLSGAQWAGIADRIIAAAESYGSRSEPATRENAAEALLWLYYSEFPPYSGSYFIELTDTAGKEAQDAVNIGLMTCFPAYGLFNGQYVLHACELAHIANLFSQTCFNSWNEAHDYSYSDLVRQSRMISWVGMIDRYLERYIPCSEPAVTVDNSRGNDWYCTQYDGSYYAGVNCMPTITAMAIRWYSGQQVSPPELRERYLPEYDEGWWMWQVEEVLESYAVPYESKSLSFDDMIADLDRGRIILTQMSEADLAVSGHCLVIYGYRRIGESVEFLFNDPGISSGVNKYGEPQGKGLIRDSQYIYWIIDRFVFNYVAVG